MFPTTISSTLPTPMPILAPIAPLSEPSLPPSKRVPGLKPITWRCKGYFWNSACENRPTRQHGGCPPCNQGFSVNFNLLRIISEVRDTFYKNYTYISSSEFAVKFNSSEEAESQSKIDPNLKLYESPYGRTGEEIFVNCTSTCCKITLKNPDPLLLKSKVGCCLWTRQRCEKATLLMKQGDEGRALPSAVEGVDQLYTSKLSALLYPAHDRNARNQPVPVAALYSSSRKPSSRILKSASSSPSKHNFEQSDEVDEDASKLSALLYPGHDRNARSQTVPMAALSSSSSSKHNFEQGDEDASKLSALL